MQFAHCIYGYFYRTDESSLNSKEFDMRKVLLSAKCVDVLKNLNMNMFHLQSWALIAQDLEEHGEFQLAEVFSQLKCFSALDESIKSVMDCLYTPLWIYNEQLCLLHTLELKKKYVQGMELLQTLVIVPF